jgi:hypothetical protein
MNTDAIGKTDDYAAIFSKYFNHVHPAKLPPSPITAAMYRTWFKQLRAADAFLHAPIFMSKTGGAAFVPNITLTRGTRASLPKPAMIERSRVAPFMTKEITDYIHKTNVTHCLLYSAKDIRGRSVNINILHCGNSAEAAAANDEDDEAAPRKGISLKQLKMYRAYVYKIYAWFHFIQPYVSPANNNRTECSKEINLYFYFTPFKKMLPRIAGETLGPAHANTGFTYPCSVNPHGGKTSTEIIIFREEEWFKVLLHETMHNLELDFNTHDGSSLREIFPGIRHDVLLSEAYAETWARILNLAFYVFYDMYGGNGTFSQYNAAVQKCLSVERAFSLFQIDKTLNYMGLSYSDIISGEAAVSTVVSRQYRETTNIFAYYVLAGIMVFNVDAFMRWCVSNNAASLVQATNGGKGVSLFKTALSEVCTNERMLRILTAFENSDIDAWLLTQQPKLLPGSDISRTMKMTAWKI